VNSRHALALGCAYFLGWAFILGKIIVGSGAGGRAIDFIIIQVEQRQFIEVIWLLRGCFTVPCVLLALIVLVPSQLWKALQRK
jgi:hypothetical protein